MGFERLAYLLFPRIKPKVTYVNSQFLFLSCILACLVDSSWMHLTGALAVAITALVTSRLTARITALGLVGEALHRMERLIVRAEGKRLPTVLARKVLVLVIHW